MKQNIGVFEFEKFQFQLWLAYNFVVLPSHTIFNFISVPHVTEPCTCDKNDVAWRYEEGIINVKEIFPITNFLIGDTDHSNEKSYLTLGPLTCKGKHQGWRSRGSASVSRLASRPNFDGLSLSLGCPCLSLGLGLGDDGQGIEVSRTGLGLEASLET